MGKTVQHIYIIHKNLYKFVTGNSNYLDCRSMHPNSCIVRLEKRNSYLNSNTYLIEILFWNVIAINDNFHFIIPWDYDFKNFMDYIFLQYEILWTHLTLKVYNFRQLYQYCIAHLNWDQRRKPISKSKMQTSVFCQ